jgi:hypothetical protein
MSRLPHFLDNGLTDGGEVVSLTCWPPFTPRKIPGTSRPQGHSAAGNIRSIEKSNDFNENRTRDLPVCSIVPQPIWMYSESVQFESPLPHWLSWVRSRPNRGTIPDFPWRGCEKQQQNSARVTWCHGRDSNRIPEECKSTALPLGKNFPRQCSAKIISSASTSSSWLKSFIYA